MTTLMKPRKRNGLHSLENRLLSPWGNSLFPSNLTNLMNFDTLFDEDSFMPAMNVQEHEKEFEIDFASPGFNKKDFEVTIEDDVLNVCGEKEAEEEEKENDYSRKEFSFTSFKKSMLLPSSVDLDQDVKASYKNGVLKIKLLKKEAVIEKTSSKKIIEVL